MAEVVRHHDANQFTEEGRLSPLACLHLPPQQVHNLNIAFMKLRKEDGRGGTGGRRVCQWGRVLLRWVMASCCHAGAVRRSLLLSFVEIQEVRRGGAGACRDVAERQGRGVVEGP